MIKLYHGDCLKLMPNIPDKSIDMVLADLPYGTTRNDFDKVIPMKPMWAQYKRIIKDHGAILLFGQEPFSSHLRLSAPKSIHFRYDWIWRKSNATGFLNANRMPLKCHEVISVFYKSLPTYHPQRRYGFSNYSSNVESHSSNYGKYKGVTVTITDGSRAPIDIIKFSNAARPGGGKSHPTQKPVKLLEYLIKTYTNPGMVVLDNTMGSGSTGVAAKKLGRDFIGMELTEKYYKIACERIKDTQVEEQVSLF